MPIIQRLGAVNTITGLLERALHWWPVVIGATGTGTLTAWAAYASAWLNNYGPIAWVTAGLVGVFLFSVVYWLWTLSRLAVSRRAYAESLRERPLLVNPLQDTFTKQKINVSDFYSPFNEWNEKRKFIDCELYGPAVVLLSGCTVGNIKIRDCDFIKVRDSATTTNVIGFQDCTFTGGAMYRLTFLFPEKNVKDLEGMDIRWLN